MFLIIPLLVRPVYRFVRRRFGGEPGSGAGGHGPRGGGGGAR
jgi:hypothetical protein